MTSSWAFKITASLIKPTRDALLDYCSYILIIISAIGISRVVIGNYELKYGCFNSTKIFLKQNDGVLITNDMNTMNLNKEREKYCLKYYQGYFSYILIVESIILLIIGILWVKMPKVQSLIHDFSGLVHESCKSTCLKSVAGVSQSNFLLTNNSAEVRLLLEAMFDPGTDYCDKAKARCLYEKIQKFTYDHEHSNTLWLLYIRKSIVQFFFWLLSCTINMVLFIKLEFYVGCSASTEYCSHDTFLRIVWFMGQILFLVYGLLNCSTLKWINEKSVTGGKSAFCKFVCGVPSSSESFHIRPYSIGRHQRAVHNDMALLLYLVSSSNMKNLPYFTLFLYDEWKVKLSSIGPGTHAPVCAISHADTRVTTGRGMRSAASSDDDDSLPMYHHIS